MMLYGNIILTNTINVKLTYSQIHRIHLTEVSIENSQYNIVVIQKTHM